MALPMIFKAPFRWYTTPPGMAAWLGLMRIVVAVCKLLRAQLKQRPLPWSQHTRSLHYCHGLRCAAGGQSSDHHQSLCWWVVRQAFHLLALKESGNRLYGGTYVHHPM